MRAFPKYISFIIIIIIMIFQSCAPDEFVLNQESQYLINGIKLSSLNSIEQIATNALLLHENSITGLCLTNITQIYADFTMELRKGNGIRFAVRTNLNDYPNHPSITLDWTIEGCIVKENGKVINVNNSIKAIPFYPTRIIIVNDCELVKMYSDCNLIAQFKTKLPCTEYVVIEAEKGTEALAKGIEFFKVSEKNYDNPFYKE